MKKIFYFALGALATRWYLNNKNKTNNNEYETKQEKAAEQVKEAVHAVKEAVIDGVEQVRKGYKH